jgi:hypothetical protein
MKVTVEAYSGYRASERPRRFALEDRSYEVVEIVDRWYSPEAEYFKVKAEDHNFYILRYDSREDEWELKAYRQAGVTSR